MQALALLPWQGAIGGALAGAIIGSFIGTLVLRWPQGRSVVAGRSACDSCARQLTARDLVPLFSWLAMRGRCRTCGASIDPLHPLTEALAAMIGATALWFAPDLSGLALALFGWLLLPLALLDARHFWLPYRLSWLLVATGLALGGFAMSAAAMDVPLVDRVIGAATGFVALWLIGFGYRTLRGRDGLGGGDPPMLAGIGAWMGWSALPFVLLLAAAAGLGIALVRRLGGEQTEAMRLPLGTLMVLAVPATLLALVAVR